MKKGQIKIQQTAFMLIAVLIFFALVGMILLNAKFINNNIMKMLTKQKLEKQDFVDNEIFELIQKLVPKRLEWDIEIIGAVRDVIREQVVNRKKIIKEDQFYPYIN